MDKAHALRAKKINYNPLIWILLALSLLATIAFFFRAFIIQDNNGQEIAVYAYQLFSRNNTILNDPSFSILRATLITGLLLGIVNICMSLWQGGYKNARRMKTLNSIRFTITTLSLTGLIFAIDIVSHGTVSVKNTLSGALGINCAIYFSAFLINLYYCSNNKLTIINYKAISAILIAASSALWAISFLNIDGTIITGTQAILAPMAQHSSLEIASDGTFIALSHLFTSVFLYNLIWNLIYTVANKSYRRHNIIRYLIGAIVSAYYAYYCITTLGSTIQGSMGILGVCAVYLVLAMYTILAFKKLKYKIYSNVYEEMIYDDDDKYYDEESRFVDNVATPFSGGDLITIKGQELQDIDDYHNSLHKRPIPTMPKSKALPKTTQDDNQPAKGPSLVTTSEYQEIERQEVKKAKEESTSSTPIILINNASTQSESVVGEYLRYENNTTEYIKADYLSRMKDQEVPKEVDLNDIFISEKQVSKVAQDPPKSVQKPKRHNNTHISKLLKDAYEDYPISSSRKVLDNNNDDMLFSYSDTNKALLNDSTTDNYINYSQPSALTESHRMVVTPPTKGRRFRVVDMTPSRIIPLSNDTFYASLHGTLRQEFHKLFMTNALVYAKAPKYLSQGDNTLFFSNIMKYIGLPIISIELAMAIYQFIIELYERDIVYVSKCNRLMIDLLYGKSHDNIDLLPIIKNICNKEIRLMLSRDIHSTLPVIDRLIRVYIRINNLTYAIKLCNTVIGFNLSSDITSSFLRLRERVMLLRAN